jgi:hypothetical protein
MAPKINPNSIHLGKDQNDSEQISVDNLYFADYFPAPPKEEQPIACALPPDIPPLFPPKAPLEPLRPVCEFLFPDVTLLPPVFNPKVELPCVCETLEASTNILLKNFKEGSFLTFSTGGPANCNDPVLASSCALNFTGFLEPPDACPSVALTVSGNFSKPFAGSSITLEPKDDNCGHNINYDFNLDVCEDFSANICPGGIAFGKAFSKDSKLTLQTKPKPNCGVELCGNLDLQVCVDFESSIDIAFSGTAVKSQEFSLESVGAENGGLCSSKILGRVEIDACPEINVLGQFLIEGNAVKSNTTKITKQDSCGLVFEGGVKIDACIDTVVKGDVCVRGNLVSNNSLVIKPLEPTGDSPVCGLEIGGCIDLFDACKEFDVEVDFAIDFGSSPPEITTVLTPVPSCGFKTTQKHYLDACKDICITGRPDISSGKLAISNSLALQPKAKNGDHCCGLEWVGALTIDGALPCPDFSLNIDVSTLNIGIKRTCCDSSPNGQSGEDRLTIPFSVTKSGDLCNPQISIKPEGDLELTIPCAPTTTVTSSDLTLQLIRPDQTDYVNIPFVVETQTTECSNDITIKPNGGAAVALEIPCPETIIIEKKCLPGPICGEGSTCRPLKFVKRTEYDQPSPLDTSSKVTAKNVSNENKQSVFELDWEELIRIDRCPKPCEELKFIFWFRTQPIEMCIPELLVELASNDKLLELVKTDEKGDKQKYFELDFLNILKFDIQDLDGCAKKLTITFEGQEVELLKSMGGVVEGGITTTQGCNWQFAGADAGGDVQDDSIRIGKNSDGELALLGKLPIPCFSCSFEDPGTGSYPFAFTDIELNSLRTNFITAPEIGFSGGCCDEGSENMLHICQGFLKFSYSGTEMYLDKENIKFYGTGQGQGASLSEDELRIDDGVTQTVVAANKIDIGANAAIDGDDGIITLGAVPNLVRIDGANSSIELGGSSTVGSILLNGGKNGYILLQADELEWQELTICSDGTEKTIYVLAKTT